MKTFLKEVLLPKMEKEKIYFAVSPTIGKALIVYSMEER